MKFLKSIACVLLVLIFGAGIFYFWGSSAQLSGSKYYQVKTYSEPVSTAGDTLSIMTYNIGYLSGMTNNLPMDRPASLLLNNLKSLNALIKEYSPDIIGFQEIDFSSKRSLFMNQMDSIAISGNYRQGYQSINWDKNYVPFPYWPPSQHFGEMLSGQAVLSRFEILSAETLVLEKPINAPFYYNAFYLDRLLQICQLRVDDQNLTLMNVHLEAFDKETREAQAQVVKQVYDEYAEKGPTILLGDFNSKPPWEEDADQVMITLLSGENLASAILEDDYRARPSDYYTFDSETPYQMIDYILYTPKYIELVEARVLQNAGQISDHFPVQMKFIFSRPNETMISE